MDSTALGPLDARLSHSCQCRLLPPSVLAAESHTQLRSIYRLVEFAAGENDSYLQRHEAFFYALETLPIFLAVVLFIIFPPSRYIPNDKSLRMNGESVLPMTSSPGLSTSSMGENEKSGFALSRLWTRRNK
jgi:hypothetical protein